MTGGVRSTGWAGFNKALKVVPACCHLARRYNFEMEIQSPMQETQIVYKRNSAWWIATCYLVGTFFLCGWAVISLLGLAASIGTDGIKALKEVSDQTAVERMVAASLKDKIELVSFSVEEKNGRGSLAVSIKNNSDYAIRDLHLEVAQLDDQGIPLHTHSEWLTDLSTIFPGDTGYSHQTFDLTPGYSDASYSVRLTDFEVLGDTALQDMCTAAQQ